MPSRVRHSLRRRKGRGGRGRKCQGVRSNALTSAAEPSGSPSQRRAPRCLSRAKFPKVVRRQRKADQPTPKLACYGSCGRSGGMRKQMRRPGHRPAVLRCVSHRRSLAAACVSERSLHSTCWGSWWLSRSYPAPSQSSTKTARSSQPRATPRTMKPARHRCTACAHYELRRTGSERACCLEHSPRGGGCSACVSLAVRKSRHTRVRVRRGARGGAP